MDLQKEIDAGRSEFRSDHYAMSVGEWISLYESKEIDIHPDFQRFYRWDIWQKSRFIESILLGIPIPPVSVRQREDGVWDVVDGLQRLSTIFQFAGILRDGKGVKVEPLALERTEYLPSLKGIVWNADFLSEQQLLLSEQASPVEKEHLQVTALTITQRLLIRRAKMPVNIILKESDERSKYDLFLRLKGTGTYLSNQGLRNCILASANYEMYEWLRGLSREENFINCVNLTDQAINEQYDLELALRFVVFRDLEIAVIRNIGDVGTFLAIRMRDLALSKSFDKEHEGRYFKETCEIVARTTRENSFRRYDTKKGRFSGGFLTAAFEAIALGIGYNLDLIKEPQIDIEEKIKNLWQMQEFMAEVVEGSTSERISKVISIGRELFKT